MAWTNTEFVFRGWQLANPPDEYCWLDCTDPGELALQQAGQQIILCRRHAAMLEEGSYRGDYSGAPLPPDSRATAWPWMPAGQAA